MPALAANILDQATGSIPTVELDIDLPACGQERGQLDQDLAGDAVLGAKGDALSFGPLAIETPHGLGPQVELQIDGGYVWANAHRADHIAKRVLVARLRSGAFAVVEEPIDGLYVTRVLVLLAQRVVDVDVDDLGGTDTLCFGNEPGDLMGAQGSSDIVGLPRADAQKVGHIRRVGGCDELPL